MTAPGDRTRLPHDAALDGVRGLAVAVVVLYHGGVAGLPGGFLGVSTFFTLSGFLIGSLLLAEHAATGRIALGAFWERRARRILPAALLALGGIALFGATVADAYQLARLRGDGLAALAWVVNWWFIANERGYLDIFASPSPLQHFWSLAIEEQFYVVFPLLAAFVLRRWGRRRLALVCGALWLASVAAMWRLAGGDASTARLYYGTDTRAAELLAGVVLAACIGPWGTPRHAWWSPRSLAGVAGLVVCAAFWADVSQDDAALYTGGLAAYSAATVAMLAAAVSAKGPVRRLFCVGVLRRLGRISYGLYLYHFPIFLWLTPERTGLGDAALLALRAGISLGLAAASYRFVEAPIRYGQRLRGIRTWRAPLAASTVVALALVGVTAGPAGAPPAAASSVAAGPAVPPDPHAVRILVVGDSVAEGIAAGLDRWGRATGRAVVTPFTVSGCGLAPPGESARRGRRQQAPICQRFLTSLAATVDRVRPQVVVVYTAGWDMGERRVPGWTRELALGDPLYDHWLRGQYVVAARTLARSGARVVWLTSMCARPHAPGSALLTPDRVRHLNHRIIDAVGASERDRVTVVDLFGAVCPRERFTNVLDGVPDARPDGTHFSEAGADWAARWLGPQLLRAAGRDDGAVPPAS